MTRQLFFYLLLGMLVVAAVPATAQNPQQTKPFGVALFHPVQFPEADHSIRGIRLTVFYSRHQNLSGLDLGVLFPVNVVEDRMKGVQLGLFNGIGHGKGVQWGLVNHSSGPFSGVQIGAANLINNRASVFQLGIFNQANIMNGFQLGIVNSARRLQGLQVGFVNIKGNRGPGFPDSVPYRVFPLVNWTF